MKGNSNIITVFLILVIIMLAGIVGGFGYTIYNEIMGDGEITVKFEGDTGFPVIEYNASSKNETNIDNEMFSGVEGNTNTTIPVTNKYRHLYNQLDADAKKIYDLLYENKENLKTGTYTVKFGDAFSNLLTQDNGEDKLQRKYQSAIEALIYENPDLFYLDATSMYINIEKITRITGVKYNVYINNGSKTSYLAEGFYSKEDVNNAIVQVEAVKNNIIAKTVGQSDYEKMRIVHDYLIDNIEYDTTLLENNIYDIYGALVLKKCVCEGYAKAFQYIIDGLGIDNVITIGTGTNSKNETENHAWNYVKLDNNWYAVDVTWDDPILIGGGKLSNKSRYQYFMKGSEEFNENHIPSGKFTDNGQLFNYPILSSYNYK